MTKLILFDFFGVIMLGGNIPNVILNQELLQFIKVQKNKYKTAILSNSGVLLRNKLVLEELDPYFDEVFLARELNLSKSDPEIYKLVAKKFNINPEEILFIDDQEWRIQAAAQAGCSTILFENNRQLFNSISKLI